MTRFSAQSVDRTRRVLVIEDDDQTRAEFVSALGAAGYEVAEAWGVVQAMRLLLAWKPHAVILDLVLPDGNGMDVGRAMRAIVTTSRTCVVAVTSSASALDLVDPKSFGAETILVKPVTVSALLAAVDRCFSDSDLLPMPLGVIMPRAESA